MLKGLFQAVQPLLQERTRRKINVLSGCGQDDLLKIMAYSSLPNFCFALLVDHPFHQQLYDYIKNQSMDRAPVAPVKQGSVHVTLLENASDGNIAKILESELENLRV
ncbi:phosphatidylinositol/phosphatidylcholine transfer protein SFH2-like [Salvia divinorum]|uniref:Phosphatidylinositol/phosphatidylcholine transfer protein SFH2-like n=1 Tax=Salvia divinorum TaxID=28513 RepID=A0ABD1HVG3_SALDI